MTTQKKDNDSNINVDVPYNDYREIDEDMFDDSEFYKNGNNHMAEDNGIISNEEERSENGGTVRKNDLNKNSTNHTHEDKLQNNANDRKTRDYSEKDSSNKNDYSGRYNLRRLRTQTSCGEFERNFYDYEYNCWNI